MTKRAWMQRRNERIKTPVAEYWCAGVRLFLTSLVLLQLSCSSPSRQCESQFDCFGSEVCIDGECVMQVVITEDMSQPDPGDASAANNPPADTGLNHDNPDLPRDNPPDSTDMPADVGACAPGCDDGELCAGFGECVPASTTTVWALDDVEIARHRTAEGHYFPAFDSLYIAIPYWGRNVTVTVDDVSTTAPFSASCADFQNPGFALSLITSDNGWGELDALPGTWSGLIATDASCPDGLADGDTLERWELELTALSSTSATGTLHIEIAGAGPRAGETLRITSSFDVMLEAM